MGLLLNKFSGFHGVERNMPDTPIFKGEPLAWRKPGRSLKNFSVRGSSIFRGWGADLRVCVLPVMPGLYHFSETVFVVTKILDEFGIDTKLIRRWEG